ncbi:YeeE/YedE family protein [Marinobacterium rhizophilum]|uniref:YeeE/YedE family protein n=1 Tax=Marinobacterium rhizophilum TaxID=420402 RepID=A0ABY5HEX3_9GAMM|nr:YeeE/YedE family protein [Marinobacterium rhizophilum]UTW10143.1 YeeE/YedE family protein [Marinobacterium rhizophilum]
MLVCLLGFSTLNGSGLRHFALFGASLLMGAVLVLTEIGFTTCLRRLVLSFDTRALRAPLVLIGATTLLFAPLLYMGEVFGQALGPAAAPVGVQVVVGALLFGVGMQLGGGCGSGTLYSLGGGNGRMLLVIVAFCAGSFGASLQMGWWQSLPSMDTVLLGQVLGWWPAALLQLVLLATLWWLAGLRPAVAQDSRAVWPLWFGALALALLNMATLALAGHPWSITWAYALLGAKVATLLGWSPAGAPFWQAPFQSAALANDLLQDVTSLMDIGLVLGACGAALAAGRWALRWDLRPGAVIAAILGGLLMGYGARIAFGCTIGALVSGIASTSLHGWLWFVAVLPGVWLGARLRPFFFGRAAQ